MKDTNLNIKSREEMLVKLKQFQGTKFIIVDTDEYSNLRKKPNTNSIIIEKIKNNDNIDWGNIESKKGNIGGIFIFQEYN